MEYPGWKTHYRPGDWSPRFGLIHATAAPRTQSDATQVRIVRDGRSDLPGPIANACVDRQGRWHVLSAGRCNSTLVGTAGPFEGLGNTYALSTEACNDNISEPWPDVQYRAYVRGWAAWCKRLGWTASKLVGHKEHTPGRKSDPTFDMDRFRADVAAVLAGEDDDMPEPRELWEWDGIKNPYDTAAENEHITPANALHIMASHIRQLHGKVDRLSAAVGELGELDAQEVAAAIPDTIARQVADLLAARLAS